VVVATVGRVDRLERALVSLVAMDDPDFEVLVVDNRPAQPATRALVERLAVGGRIRYTQAPRPGLAIARNAGIAATGGAQVLAFTDDDVVADPGWLRWLLTPFADPIVQGTTGMVLPLELASPSQKRFELYSGFGKGVDPTLYDLTEHRADDRLLYPYWGGMFGSGNSMAFRRRTLLEIGGFDPALGAGTPTGGGEDTAAFTDVILRGGRLAYEPRSICWHEHRRDEKALRAQVYNYGVGFTAALWRYATRDPRFYVAVARTVPVVARLARTRKAQRETDRLPADLTRLEMRGRLVGPHRYVKSRRAASRMQDESPGA
jgi:GT2 family glycosyltransferase